MFVQKLLIVATLTGACAACQSMANPEISLGGEVIAVEGVVEILSGGHGLGYITLDDGRCYDLALPSGVLKNSGRWDMKRVAISGVLQFRPRIEEMMWFDIKDRRIEGFGCSEDVIYVDTIEKL